MTKKNFSFKFSIVPNFIKPEKGLSPTAKLIYGDIYSLCQQMGFCYASNNYFEKLYGVSKSTITKSVHELQKYEYIICDYPHRNYRKIYLTEKKCVEKPDLSQIDDDKILPSVEEQIPNSYHPKNQKQPSSSLNPTIRIVNFDHNKRKETIIDNKTEFIKRENRSSKELPLTFSNKDQLESELLHALSSLYNLYKIYDFDSIITSIEEELTKDTCKQDIFQLGLKEWFKSVLTEDRLVVTDENLTEEEFYNLNESFIDDIFDVLTG